MTFGPAATNPDGTPNPAGAKTDVFATNFFLNDDFSGTVTANPFIQNVILDINFYIGLDAWIPGLFFRIDIPINWTSWTMALEETITTTGTVINTETFGNFAPAPSPLSSIIQAWKGQTLDTEDFPQLKQKLQFNRIDGAQSLTGVADLTCMLGYNFWLSECGHFGLSAAVIIPTNDRPSPEFLFTPVVGNGDYTEVGMGITGHYEFWDNCCDQSCAFYLEGAVYHILSASQKRTFDLKENGIGSRYLLFKNFTGTPALVYNDEILFGPNVTTLECNVKNNVHADIALMFDYRWRGLNVDCGYNLWTRSRDILTITGSIPSDTFGVQGATQTAGASMDNTQSMSTIRGFFAPPFPGDMVPVTTESLDPLSASYPTATSHKIFLHVNYTWQCSGYLPFVGLGGEYEITSNKNNTALNQWGCWIKGGFRLPKE